MLRPHPFQELLRQLREDQRDEGALMNATSGTMWIVAGLGGLAGLALPGTARVHLGWLLALAAIAFAWGFAVLTLRYPRPGTPLSARAAVTAGLIGIVGVALWASGGAASYLQPVLLFTALHVAYFYPPRYAWPLNALFVLAYSTPLLYDDAAVVDEGYPARILLFAIAVAGTYAIMRLLKRRLVSAEQRQRAMAERDPLTGVANRRAFDAALVRAVAGPDMHGRSAALLLLDFDDFKSINDTYGHPIGDVVLRAVAAACSPQVRGVDCFARIGGDEFAVIAPGAGEHGVGRLAEALEAALAEAAVPREVGAIAVTIAWATVPEDATTAEGLMQVADRRLIARKRERRLALAGNVRQLRR